MNTEILENIGLSATEVKIFITLLEIGEAKAGKIIEKSKLQSSSTYNAINSLIERGLVSYIKKSQVKYYRAADPESILNYIDLKKREFQKILPELKGIQNKQNKETVEYYKSFKGIKTIMSELFKDAKKGEIYRSFSIEDPEHYKSARERVYVWSKQLAKEKGIITKGIFHEKNRERKTKTTTMEKRYVEYPLPPNTMIFHDKVAIISWGEEPSGVLIHSKDHAEKYKEFFDHLWKLGNP